MRSTPSRRSDASHSFRMESGRSTRRASAMGSRSSHTRPHLVNTSGRSPAGSFRSRRPTTSSEWPRPYTAAVSIQLIPSSRARRIAASESASSCGPQPYAQPPPPIAHAPKPTVVMSDPLEPSGRVRNVIRTARLAVQHHHPPTGEAIEPLLEGRLADGVVDHLQSGSVGQTLHLGLEVVLGVQDNLVGAGPSCQRGLLARRDRAQHARTPEFRDLTQQQTHAPCGGVHQAGVPGLQGVGRGREVVRRQTLKHRGGALFDAHSVRQHDDPVRRHDRVLRIRTEDRGIGNAFADLGLGDTGANGGYGAGRFLSQCERHRNLVVPIALIHVDEVHAGGFDLHEDLAWARGGPLDLLVAQRFRTTRRVHAYRFHPSPSPSPDGEHLAEPRCSWSCLVEHMNVSFIGLGSMGLPMARHLLQAGHKLVVYNRTRARADQLRQLNPVVADSPAAAARDADVLITMVADDAALEEVILGPQGALAALSRGAIHVSMSTISPALSRRLAELHKAAGQAYVAAPVFGRPEAAEARKLWIVAAGPPQALERCGPVLDAMGQGVIVAGDDPPRANEIGRASCRG